jgi:hypothetical protein
MRRTALLLLTLGLGTADAATAQSTRVGMTVRLAPETTPGAGHQPIIGIVNLFRDTRWSEALEQAFPIRLHFRIEIWRSRESWIDEFQRFAEWSIVVQREPLEENYRVTDILQAGTSEARFPSRIELERNIGTERQIEVLPRGTGTFYYNVRLRIRALSDEDMDELERFLAGETNAPRTERSPLARSMRRLFLRMAGLPSEDLEIRSEKFTVPGRRD